MADVKPEDGGSKEVSGRLYQLEVKLHLVRLVFPPSSGWKVTVDVDAMERARGGSHPSDKASRAASAFDALCSLGATIGEHDHYGRVDLIADHPEKGRRVLEVEGDSSRQPDQAMYSALGQLLLSWRGWNEGLRYGVAVPETRRWRRQLAKIPVTVRRALGLELYLVGPSRVATFGVGEQVPF